MAKIVSGKFDFDTVKEITYWIIDLLQQLSWRWDEEYKYEDIKSYTIPILKKLEHFKDFDFENKITMTKRPFGIKFLTNNYVLKNGNVVSGEIRINLDGWKFNEKTISKAA